MSDRRQFLIGPQPRHPILKAVMDAPVGHVVDIRPETRTDAQNRLWWPLLTDISQQVNPWYGRQRPPGDWKSAMMIGLEGAEWMPGIEAGQLVPVGLSSSVLSKEKFSNVIEITYAFGASHGVKFRTDK